MDKTALTRRIIKNLTKINGLKDAFKVDSEKIRSNPLESDLYKNSKVDALRDMLFKDMSAIVSQTEEDAQSLATLLREETPDFDLGDPALQNALLLVPMLGRDIPSEVQQAVVKHFEKNTPALRVLLPLFTKYQMYVAGQEAEAILREQEYDLAFLQALPDQTYYDSLTTEPTANTTRLLEYMRTFAYANGINTPEVDTDEENLQAILDAKAQEARNAYMRQIEARKAKESDSEADAGQEQTAQATASPGNKLE